VDDESQPKRRHCYLDVPTLYRLDAACSRIWNVWDGGLYLVGSVLERPSYRDVDLRLMMKPKRFRRLGSEHEVLMLNAAMSGWVASMTGLAIDFQFQDRDAANAEFPGRPRRPAGMRSNLGF
jgi:hypothetical protein